MKVKGTGSWCMLEEYVKDNYYARLHTHSNHGCSEMHFSSRLDVNFDSQCSVKCRPKAAGHSACFKSICNYYARLRFARSGGVLKPTPPPPPQ